MKRHPVVEPLEERRLLSHAPPGRSPAANPVVTWNAVALGAIREARASPPVASRDLAIVQISVFDAVDSIDRAASPYRVRVKAPAGASAVAAAVGAASEALAALFPAQAARFDSALASSISALPSTRGTAEGLALGRGVADRELALRVHDGSDASPVYTPSNQAGLWRPTPPAFAPALLPGWGKVTPFALKSGSQFRPSPPPAITSPAYAAALDQVESLGSARSTTRTPDQTQVALFWSDGSGTETPPGHWNQIAEQAATGHRDSLAKDARLFAQMDIALADAAIACWDAKYAYSLWRPITAIQPADPAWTPLIATPNFPSYVSGHSTFSAAAAAVLSSTFGANTHFATTSDGLPGVIRSFPSFQAAADEAGMSRIYGGIHYQFDNRAGLALGRSIGRYVVAHTLRKSDH